MANLTLLGNYVTSDFALSADGHGGALVKFVWDRSTEAGTCAGQEPASLLEKI